jgi:hypothetical protein
MWFLHVYKDGGRAWFLQGLTSSPKDSPIPFIPISSRVFYKTPIHYRRHLLVTVLSLTLDPLSFILGFFLGYLYYRWDIPLFLFDIVDARLYPLAVLLGVEPTYELVAQVYVYPLVGSGH